MPRYLISFNDGWMDFPEEEFPAVAKAARELVREARDAGVWVYGAGLDSQRASIVAPNGMVTDGPFPETKEVIGGFCVVDVPSREEALEWAVQDRHRLPLLARGTRDPARPAWSRARRSSASRRINLNLRQDALALASRVQGLGRRS